MEPKIITHHFGDKSYTSTLYYGQDCRKSLMDIPAKSVQCVVTSPPYFGLRDYGTAKWEGGSPECDHDVDRQGSAKHVEAQSGHASKSDRLNRQSCECGARRVDHQIGLEQTPEEYVDAMVDVFREVRRVLKDNGTVWINLGDSFCSSDKWGGGSSGKHVTADGSVPSAAVRSRKGPTPGIKPKDLLGIPWMVAFALRADGWYLRSDIIWCLSGGAWVYARTQKGDMPVMVKDLVRLNPSTVQLWNGTKWTRVLGWNQSADTTEKLELVLRSGERIGCTGGHMWPTQRGNVAARDLRVGDVIATCQIPEPNGAVPPGYMTLDATWLVGLYLAEGSRSGDMAQLSLHADEVKWLPRIESVAHYFGGTMAYTVSGNKLAVRLYGRVLMAHFEKYIGGHTAHDKHLTNDCWKLPNEYLKELTHGYLDGDGHYDPKNPRARLGFTRNYSLERDLRTIAARLGATISLRPTVATCITGKFPAFRGEWKWSKSGHGNERDMGEVTEIRASRARKFWDIGVEDEPHLFALASGVLTHNSKVNAMPESVTDRCTKSHEYIFMLTKSPTYYFNAEAIKEPSTSYDESYERDQTKRTSLDMGNMSDRGVTRTTEGLNVKASWEKTGPTRNKRSVWSVAFQPYQGAHFATFPPKLIEPCILAGSAPGDTVLDLFSGSATTGFVSNRFQRHYVGLDVNPDYLPLAEARLTGMAPPDSSKPEETVSILDMFGST